MPDLVHLTQGTLSDEKFVNEDHSFALVAGLTPIIEVSHIQKTLLGSPYTVHFIVLHQLKG